jgi:anti-sigma28 factor (negative regulator of flagellin synthesis)
MKKIEHRGEQRSEQVRVLVRAVGHVDELSLDPARAAQLAILRNAVTAGRYEPDLHEVAHKLLIEVAAEHGRR